MTRQITEIPLEERPREKLLARGARSLSDVELLAVLLGSGSKQYPVMTLAKAILKRLDEEGEVRVDKLQELPGVGPARAMLITAAMEFARRRIRPAGVKIRKPGDFLPFVRHYADRKQEHFLCTTLNGADEMIATRVVTVGLVDRSHVHPREVFAEPLQDRATSVILAHNHPSGSVQPSSGDIAITQRLVAAGNLLGIAVKDHIIFTQESHYSFREHHHEALFKGEAVLPLV